MVSRKRRHNVSKDWTGSSPVKGVRDGSLVQTTYEDPDGRLWAVLVPVGEEDEAAMGIPLGPPDLTPLGLPLEVEIRLHNQLYRRGLFTLRDVRRRGPEVFAALQAAYHTDVAAVTGLYT